MGALSLLSCPTALATLLEGLKPWAAWLTQGERPAWGRGGGKGGATHIWNPSGPAADKEASEG